MQSFKLTIELTFKVLALALVGETEGVREKQVSEEREGQKNRDRKSVKESYVTGKVWLLNI